MEVQQERRTNAHRHLNWHLKVKVDEVRVDNGAVPNSEGHMTSGNIMKTSLHSHPWQTSSKAEQSSPAGSSLKQILQVTDDCPETAVGFLDRRTALRVSSSEPTGQELDVGMHATRNMTGCRGSC